MINGSQMLSQKWVKILPHSNDTILLLSAIVLASQAQQYPFESDWITAKVLGLLVYIALGMFAFRWGRTLLIKTGAWLCALCVYLYIIGVAVSKSPVLLFM